MPPSSALHPPYLWLFSIIFSVLSFLSLTPLARLPHPPLARLFCQGGQGEDPAVQDFVRAMFDLEVERDGIERRYIDHFKIFVKLWKGVLAEKKELNSKVKEFESVHAKLQSQEKKMSKAESKEPRHKVIELMANLEGAKAAEAEAAVALREKEIEVQQDKHQALRTGYTGLYAASMSRMKDTVRVNEEMRKLVNAVPNVVGK
jgi:hypothetical protein